MMRRFLPIIGMCLCALVALAGRPLPVEMRGGHLYARWTLGDSIPLDVFLESGFPKVVISRAFAQEHLQPLLREAPEPTSIALWGGQHYRVTHRIDTQLVINGAPLRIDALVADFSSQRSWAGCEMIFPLRDLPGRVLLDIAARRMEVLDHDAPLPAGFRACPAQADSRTGGLCLTTTLRITDAAGASEELAGNFLLDLGAGNSLILNRNLPEVDAFVERSERMRLSDTTRFPANPRTALAILMPERARLGDVAFQTDFIAAMKLPVTAGSDRYAGMVGNPFFARFRVIFDFSRNTLYLAPRE